MTQDIKQQIEVMQHYAEGGEVESKHIAARDGLAEWKHNPSPEFDWVHFDYRIVGPSRAPFDPIQHMKDGGECVDSECNVWGWNNLGKNVTFNFTKSKRNGGFDTWAGVFINDLANNKLKPYQEPEKAVIWRYGPTGCRAFFYMNGSFTIQDDGETSHLPPDTAQAIDKVKLEIAQGKWERVDD